MILQSSSESFALFLHVNKRTLNYVIAFTKLIYVIVVAFMAAVFDKLEPSIQSKTSQWTVARSLLSFRKKRTCQN